MSLEATLIETNTLLKQIIAIYTTSVEAVATLAKAAGYSPEELEA